MYRQHSLIDGLVFSPNTNKLVSIQQNLINDKLTVLLEYHMSRYGCFIKEWVTDITKLLEYSKTLKKLTIISHPLPQDDTLLIADSLTVNTSVRQFKYGNGDMEQTTTLKFLEQLKQAYTVEEVTLGVSHEADGDYQFLGDVEKCVQQINQTRSTRGVSSLLKVEITLYALL